MNLRIEVLDNLNKIFIKEKNYELKIYLVDTVSKIETDITNSDKLDAYSTDYNIVYIYRKNENNPFKILLKNKGAADLVFVYDDKINAPVSFSYKINVLNDKFENLAKAKNRIEMRRENENNYGVNNSHLLNSYVNFRVYFIDKENIETDITDNQNLSFYSLDDDNLFVMDKIVGESYSVLFRKEGTGFLKAIYNDNVNPILIDTRNFICYTSFFKENYLDYFVGDFNKEKILANPKNLAVFDTFMEMLDILYAYNQDLKEISSFDNTKSNFLDLLSQNIGFLRVDNLSRNTSDEDKEDYLFRELLKNMVDLLSIRGTKAAYELFFSAIGYNIRLNEFWYDQDGDLVEIDAYDELNTTYIGYKTDGSLKDNIAKKQNDPRKDIPKQERYIFTIQSDSNGAAIRSYEMPFQMPIIENVFVYINCIKCGPRKDYIVVNGNRIVFNTDLNVTLGDAIFVLKNPDYSVFRNAKSNYMRLNIYSKDTTKFTPPSTFSTQKKKIINYYLDFLKPIHMRYLPEFLVNDIAGDENGIGEIIDFADYIDDSDAKVGKFKGLLNNQIIGKVPAIPFNDNAFDNIFSMGTNSDKIGTDENTYVNAFEFFNIVKNTLDESLNNVRNGLFDSYGKKCLRWDIDGIKFDENDAWDEKSFLLDSLTITKQ
jgi:hypothetical protein